MIFDLFNQSLDGRWGPKAAGAVEEIKIHLSAGYDIHKPDEWKKLLLEIGRVGFQEAADKWTKKQSKGRTQKG